MIDATFEFPKADIDRLYGQIRRAQTELRKGTDDSVKWAATYVARSIGAATKQSPKLRPVVRNKDKRAGRDLRVARFGVYKYRPNRERYFLPLGQTSRGRTARGPGMDIGDTIIRYVDKRTSAVIDWDKSTGKRKRVWENFSTMPDVANPELSMPGIMSDARRKIRRSGMAKKSWTKLASMIGRKAGQVGLFNVLTSSVQFIRQSEFVAIRLQNHLRYILHAMVGGRQTVSQSVARAAAAMQNRIDDRVKKIAERMNAGGKP